MCLLSNITAGLLFKLDSIIVSLVLVPLFCVFALLFGFALAVDSNGIKNLQSSET